MPFNYLLTNLLVDVPQAVGAILVDPEGEAVEWVTRHDDPFDLKVEGAYHSIFMRRLDQLAANMDAGQIDSFVLEGTSLVTLTQALPDGYYVVLVVDRSGSRAHALHRLRRAAEVIAKEIV
ncbi:MAG: roadblock/LC7 domain-containing protein [Acidobacteria bacterium]|jgi:predicted regulator of Ras-like GTPase activity (Roadblock/LC7/MglB family)|nr:roadblock/LC7 domain-containing protein [Acidobacteriota bacterium]